MSCGPLNEGAQERPFAANEVSPTDLPTAGHIDTTSDLIKKTGSVQITNAGELALIFGKDVIPQNIIFELSYKLNGNQVDSNSGELKLFAKKTNGKLYVYTFRNPVGSVSNGGLELTYHDQKGTIDVVNSSFYLDCGVVSSCVKLGNFYSHDLT